MSQSQHEEFTAERARLTAELTALALAGSSTVKTREKLAALDAREKTMIATEQATAQTAAAERREQFETEAVAKAAEIATSALMRLNDDGYGPIGENDAEKLALAAHSIVRYDADIAEAQIARDAAFQVATNIATRIDLLNAHGKSLQSLRLTGQATQRDIAEAGMVERDIETLQAAYDRAHADAAAQHVPTHLLDHRQRAQTQMQALETEIRKRVVWERARAAEHAYMDAIRRVCAESGARGPAGLYMRSPEFDRFVRTNAL